MKLHLHALKENLIYLVLWAILFCAPILSLYYRTQANTDIIFSWTEIFDIWKVYLVYLVIFLVHNIILAPILIYRHKKVMYFATTLCMLAIFFLAEYHQASLRREEFHKQQMMEQRQGLPPFDRQLPPDFEKPGSPNFENGPKPDFEKGPRPDFEKEPEANFEKESKPELEKESKSELKNAKKEEGAKPELAKGNSPDFAKENPFDFRKKGPKFKHREFRLFLFPGGRELIATLLAILMLGMNLAIKLYFRTLKREKEMLQLEQQNLHSQLEYLKYQINPHFFMNTLNNIHALVDIDPELAKETILQLSKMMRYILYEGNKQFVPLDREGIFLENYINLMKLRYDPKKVDIQIEAPENANAHLMMPPLLLVNFVENAFKHGISYQEESFIHITSHIRENRLLFTCKNSKHKESTEEHGGVGLTNTKKRLDLLFKENYQLKINDNEDVYEVTLDIPLKKSNDND